MTFEFSKLQYIEEFAFGKRTLFIDKHLKSVFLVKDFSHLCPYRGTYLWITPEAY